MPNFVVRKGHDAWVHYETIIEAGSAKEANLIADNHSYDGEWIPVGSFAEFDECRVFDEETREVADGESLEPMIFVAVSQAQLSTILAALRYWKWDLVGESPDNAVLEDIATNGGEHAALDDEAIDALYQHLNCN